MTDRRYAADGKSGGIVDEIRIGTADRFTGLPADQLLVDAICAAGQDKHGRAAGLPSEDEGFDDLSKFASGALGRFEGGAGAFCMLDDPADASQAGEDVLYFLGIRAED